MIRNKKVVNGLGVLSGYAKYLSILALAAVLTALAVSSFCTHTPENCADGQELKPGMFCFDNKAWNKCGGSEYNPYAQFCSAAGALYDKCNGKDDYDPQREFCSGNKVVSKCGNATFDPETQGCVFGIIKERCGNNYFDPNNEFCFNNIRIYDKCDGKEFDPADPASQNCAGKTVKPKCGSEYYDNGTHFCYIDNVYEKCNGKEYNPAERFCFKDSTYQLCGGREYDPLKQTCKVTNNNVTTIVDMPKCNGSAYDSAANFCHNNNLYPKCGGRVYDPEQQTCNGTTIINRPPETPRPKYTVYFNTNNGTDGSDPPKSMTVDSGTIITLPGQQTMTKEGYSFGGWSANGTNYNANDPYMVMGGATLYVRWIPIRTITFNDNGATGGDAPDAVRADSGKVITLPGRGTMVKTGFSFGWWNTKSDGTGANFRGDSVYTVTGNVTLYAKWVPVYTVTFNGNGTTAGVPGEIKKDSGSVVTLPAAMTRDGYSFGWWSTSNTGTGTKYNPDEFYTVTGNTTIYVKWIPIRTVTFNINGATSGTAPAATTVDSGTVVTLPGQGNMVKTNNHFGGWSTSSSGGTNYPAGSSYTVTNTITLYVRWIALYTLTVNVSPSDGGMISRNPAADNYESGTSVTVTTTPSSNYRFAWWLGAEIVTTNSVTITMNNDKVLTAIFYRSGTFTDARDGKIYKTVKIGNQTWMAENLNYDLTYGSWCYYEYDEVDNYCNKYGRQYPWSTAKEVCPNGWHLPDTADWNRLVATVGGKEIAGKKLKSKSGWDNNGNGTDDIGFSALPGGQGRLDYQGKPYGYSGGNTGYWWTATVATGFNLDDRAHELSIFSSSDGVNESWNGRMYEANSVRCIED